MESTPEQTAEGLAIVNVLSAVLDRLVGANVATARTDPGQVTKFHAMKAPGIGIAQYLERIHKYASCSNECFILALIYIDRLIQRNNFLLTELNVHRVVITAVLLAAKFFDDAYYNNAYYAKVGGVLVSEMNGLEVDFLFRINFSLHVAPDVFAKYHAQLLSQSLAASPPPVVQPVMTAPQVASHVPSQHVSCAQTVASQYSVAAPKLFPSVHTTIPINTTATTVHSAAAAMAAVGLPQITPSPPSVDTGRLVDELMYHQHQQQMTDVAMAPVDCFVPIQHRSLSEPGYTTAHHHHHHHHHGFYCNNNNSHLLNAPTAATEHQLLARCAQKSFSAPAVVAASSGEYVVVDHAMFAQHNHQAAAAAQADRYEEQFGRMLTGLSSAAGF